MSPQADIQPPPSLDYFPEDALCKIFSHLHCSDILKSTSLVCKQFCSLSSPLVHGLSLRNTSLTYSDFDRLFKRFPELKNICIHGFPVLDNALLAISKSDLNLEKLQLPQLEYYNMNPQYPEASTIQNMSMSRVIKGIKSLNLGWFDKTTTNLQVVEFINLFPSLTELNLNIGYPWNDKLIHKVTSKLPNLRKISLNYKVVLTNETLVILSTNCPKLESVDIDFLLCVDKFTPEALYTFFCNYPQLSSVGMSNFGKHLISKVVQCVQILKNLNRLSLESYDLEDAVLIALAEARHPLKHLLIRQGIGSSMS